MVSIFRSKKQVPIEVFVRHCNYSAISSHKERIAHFSRKGCYDNLLRTLTPEKVNLTFLLDTFHPSVEEHFIKKQSTYRVIEIKEGTETGSFLRLLDHVEQLRLPEDTLIYFLEDDYIHREGWVEILLEGFTLPKADYLTLYDHRDKYFDPSYRTLTSQLFHTTSCHWRTTPSTTNTYAMHARTLKEHLSIHRAFSFEGKITRDHEKFVKLQKTGATLLSPIPGWSTHAEPKYASPCVTWERLLLS